MGSMPDWSHLGRMPEPPMQSDSDLRCRNCGSRPAIGVSFVAGIGRVVVCIEETYEGVYCRECGLALYDRVMKRHLLNTWWSPRAILFGSTLGTARNLLERNKLLALPETGRVGAKAPALNAEREPSAAVNSLREPSAVAPPTSPIQEALGVDQNPKWMGNAGITAVTVGGLGFIASGAVGGGATLAGAIVAGALNPLFFVGVPLGLYWLHRAKRRLPANGNSLERKAQPTAHATAITRESPRKPSACAPVTRQPKGSGEDQQPRSTIAADSVASERHKPAATTGKELSLPQFPPELEWPTQSQFVRNAAVVTIIVCSVLLSALIGFAIGRMPSWIRSTDTHVRQSASESAAGFHSLASAPAGNANNQDPSVDNSSESPRLSESPSGEPPADPQTPYTPSPPAPSPDIQTQFAIVQAVGGPGGLHLEAHCEENTFAKEGDLLALWRGETGATKPTFIGLVRVMRVRNSQLVAISRGGKPAIGDELLIEAPQPTSETLQADSSR